MAILRTDADSLALTDNNGKPLVRTSGSVIDYGYSADNSNYRLNPGFDFNVELYNQISINPKSSNSKFLLQAVINCNPDEGNFIYFTFRRYINGSFSANVLGNGGVSMINPSTSGNLTAIPLPLLAVDAPGTTSSIFYRIGVRASSGGVEINKPDNVRAPYTTFTILEIV